VQQRPPVPHQPVVTQPLLHRRLQAWLMHTLPPEHWRDVAHGRGGAGITSNGGAGAADDISSVGSSSVQPGVVHTAGSWALVCAGASWDGVATVDESSVSEAPQEVMAASNSTQSAYFFIDDLSIDHERLNRFVVDAVRCVHARAAASDEFVSEGWSPRQPRRTSARATLAPRHRESSDDGRINRAGPAVA
jgi:hypothetical protein